MIITIQKATRAECDLDARTSGNLDFLCLRAESSIHPQEFGEEGFSTAFEKAWVNLSDSEEDSDGSDVYRSVDDEDGEVLLSSTNSDFKLTKDAVRMYAHQMFNQGDWNLLLRTHTYWVEFEIQVCSAG